FIMALSGICWGTYSLRGRGAKDPIIATAGNFIRGTPVALVIFALSSGFHGSARGILLAIISGAITSGLGYSVWYFVLPQIPTARAAIAQLSVPALAVLGGTVFLGESWTEQKVISALLMFSGVVIAVRPWPRTGK
ncbi:MAG: DMT family transporter, partial [Bdellovibrionia bacterium]